MNYFGGFPTKGDKGDTGATGATGATGPQGPAGTDATWVHPLDGFRIVENWCASTAAGTNGWTILANSGSVGLNASIGSTTRMGIFRLGTLASSSSAPILTLGSGVTFVFGGIEHSFETDINIGTLSSGTEEYVFRAGYMNTTTSALTSHGAFFEYDRTVSTNWRVRCRQGGSDASTNTSVAVASGWVKLKVVVNAAATSVAFYINDTLVHTETTQIPSGTSQTVSPTYQMVKTVGTTNRETYGDWAVISAGTAVE